MDPKARDCELKERLGDTGHGQDQEPSYRSTGNQEVEKNLSQPDSSVNKAKGATADINESERDGGEVEDETEVNKQLGNSRACQGDEEKEEHGSDREGDREEAKEEKEDQAVAREI